MTQPNNKAPEPKKTRKTPKKSGAAIWIASIVLLVVGVLVANYAVERAGEAPAPVVSAEEDVIDAETTVEAEPATVSELTVTSNVRGADVYLNDKRVGKTPHKQTPLAEGSYRVKVAMPGYETIEKDVEIEPETSHTMRADLKKAAASKSGSNAASTETATESESPAESANASGESTSADVISLNESVPVKHKHSFRGGCEGVLRVSADGFRFETEHKDAFSVELASIENFELDDDTLNVKVRDGKNYNFTAPDDFDGDTAALSSFFDRVSAVLGPSGE